MKMLTRIRDRLAREKYLWGWRRGLKYAERDVEHLIDSTGLEFTQKEIDYLRTWTDSLSDCAMRALVPKLLKQLGYNFDKSIYCFGCGAGGTVTAYVRGFREYGLKLPRMNLFDSFQGLPDEDPSCPSHPLWSQGSSCSMRPAFARFWSRKTSVTIASIVDSTPTF